MTLLILEFVGLAGVIVVAGAFLARYADAIGERTGLGRSLAGLVLLAIATSLPELTVDVSAARIPGAVDLAVGDLFGSSLVNLLILAVLDLAYRTGGRMLSRTAAAHAISAAMSIVLTAIPLVAIVAQLAWAHSRGDAADAGAFWGLGPGTWAIAVAYLVLLRLIYFDQRYAAGLEAVQPPASQQTPPPPPAPAAQYTLRHAAIGYLATTVAILIAAPLLAHTADALAGRSGLGHSFVGTVFVALTTSLPEVVTTLAAVRMRAYDLAVGNILGSNSFNMTILPLVDLFYPGTLLADVSPIHAVTAGMVIVTTAAATMGLLYRAERRYWVVEPDAALVVLLVLAAFGLVYALG